MTTSTNSTNNNISKLIKENIVLFVPFKHVYLFGSALDTNKIPNDIDLLLIYSEYSTRINEAVKHITLRLESICDISVDLTVLSVKEERDVNFLNRISPKYIQLK